jgi:DGQHR domain-containing protein
MSQFLSLPVIPIRQNGTIIYLTKMRAADLPRFTKVEPFQASLSLTHRDQGYQRSAELPRVKKFSSWLKEAMDRGDRVYVPTAILLSSRDLDLHFDPRNNEIKLNAQTKLYLVDGQHRTEGFRYAIEEKHLERAADVEVPVVIVPGMRKEAEMRQFATVNGTQKSVRTDLVNMILTQLAQGEGEDTLRPSERWKVVVSQVVKNLNDAKGGPWCGLVVMPNESGYTKQEKRDDRTLENLKLVRATSFMTSLKPIYDYLDNWYFPETASLDDRVARMGRYLAGFWEAVRDLNPEVFKQPGKFVLQKTPGLFALHQVCKIVMGDMYKGRREWDRQNFKMMLEPSDELRGAEFWDAKLGQAAAYGSMKGFADLASIILEGLSVSAR